MATQLGSLSKGMSSMNLQRIQESVQELGLLTHKPFGATTAPRAAWMVLKRLPIPGYRMIVRGLGRLGPIVNVGFAVADIWVAIDDWISVKRNPGLEQLVRANASTLLAICSGIAALNIPLISAMGAVMALVVDFLKQSLLSINLVERGTGLEQGVGSASPEVTFISNPTSNGGLAITPAETLATGDPILRPTGPAVMP